MLVANFTTFMEHMKIFRVISLFVALVYAFIWYIASLMLYSLTSHEPDSVVELLVGLFIAYNLFFHSPIMIMNLVIIYKEFSLEADI